MVREGSWLEVLWVRWMGGYYRLIFTILVARKKIHKISIIEK
jgi:hypothetical protein